MKYYKKIEGKRVYLSPVNPEDVEKNIEWSNDLSLTAKVGMATYHYGCLNTSEELSNMSRDGAFYSIILKTNNRLIGNCNFFNIDHINRTSEMAIIIGNKEDRFKGYGREAIELIVSYGFKVMNLNNIMVKIFAFNKSAIKTFKNVGFKVAGKRRECYYLNGNYYDEIYMEVLQSEYSSNYLEEKLNFSDIIIIKRGIS